MSEFHVTVVRAGESAERTVRTGTKAWELFADDPDVVAAEVGDQLVDLSYKLGAGDVITAVLIGSGEGLAILRHSTAHVAAQAVQQLFPDAKLGIGPPIEDGFYYDFDVAEPFKPDDVERIQSQMRRIVKENQQFSRREVSDDEARRELSDEPYKLELIDLKGSSHSDDTEVEVGADQLTIYDNVTRDGSVAWKDLCRGPHLPTTRRIPAFKLMRTAAAYWRGDDKNKQLQRLYGTAWPSKEDLDTHLEQLAEAERRDHRRLGVELDLFSFPAEIGPGLAVFHPKGGVLRKAMEDYARMRHEQGGYEFVYTPHISKEQLFQTSGHLEWYADGMYPPMHLDEERDSEGNIRKPGQNYYPKPMNCPMHILVFKARARSYRELPLRLFEFGTVYRYEMSGVVHGLTRARGFTQDDSHIFCTPDQLAGELASLLTFVIELLRDYGLEEFSADLSTRPDNFVGDPVDWDIAEAALENALQKSGVEYAVAEGEGAFYAPKIDVHVKDAIGRRWQLSTLQVDLQFPDRFDLTYQTAAGTRERPYMIHRALFGSIERFLGILVEHYAGAFPPWLAPVQVVAIPIAERHGAYLNQLAERLRSRGIRVEVDDSDERMQKKIRTAQLQKVPYMLIAGDRDVEQGAVSFRYRSGEQDNGIGVDEAVDRIVKAVESRTNV